MTTPRVSTIKRAGARFYVHPSSGSKAPGVTSVVGMLPKEFLKYWAAKSSAEFAADNLGALVTLALAGGRDAAVDMIKRSPDRDVRQAADTGTEAHKLFEVLARGESPGRVHPDFEPYVAHFRDFLAQAKPKLSLMEETVWSETHDYAGSFDAYGEIDGQRLFIDWKTTRSGVHEEVALQLAGYRFAEYIIRGDGARVPLPPADGGAVLHVRPEGWELIPVRCDESVFEFFLHLRQVFEWEKGVKSTVLGDPAYGSIARRVAAPRRVTIPGRAA